MANSNTTGTAPHKMCSAFNACLAARGYNRSDATGTLTVPERTVVQCAKTDS
jgi:hypothetical protein